MKMNRLIITALGVFLFGWAASLPFPQAAWAQGTEICAQCHTDVKEVHHNLPMVGNCGKCHGGNFSRPDCFQCHPFSPGPGAELHDVHTAEVPDCQTCHTGGVPVGGPIPVPFDACPSCHTGFQGGPAGELHQEHTQQFGAACSTCHGENAPACSECHQVPQHDFRSGPGAGGHDFHTGFIDECQRCHTQGVPGGGPVPVPFTECDSCHEGFQGGPQGELHQQHTQQFGASDCTVCHGEGAPACNECHQIPRHDFRTGPGSGGHDFHTGFITDCQRCHTQGVPGGGPVPVPFTECDSCHTGFQGGPAGELHQAHTQNFGAGDCTVCHGENAPACNECHQVNRHDFRTGPGSGGHDFHTAFINDCQRCHTQGVPGGGPLPEPFGECASCHTGFQNGPQGELHQEHTQQFGASNCNTCHGEDAPACNACHQQPRHDFRTGPGSEGHDFHTQLIDDCQKCHVSGVPGGPLREPFGECAECHRGFKDGPQGDLHQEHTQQFGASDCTICHGEEAPACNQCHQVNLHDFRTGPGSGGHEFHTSIIEDCQRCHTSGAPGGPLREPFGQCANCHTGFQGGPQGQLHQLHTQQFGASDCTICHGEDAPACSQCHQVPRHDFRTGPGSGGHDFHTQIINDCQRCHVSGAPGGGPLPEPFGECATCHTGFEGGPQGELHRQHTQTFGATDCNTCHGENAPACNSCHQVPRHDFREGPGSPGHNFHTSFITDCQRCHVSGVPGGGPIPVPFGQCSECHTGFHGGPQGQLHQRHTNTFGASDCGTCHGENAPACNACHQVDGHDFRSGIGAPGHDFHTDFINKCQTCHVAGVPDVQLRIPFRACASCHRSFQNRGELHREHVQEEGVRDCTICHGDNAPGCTSCHEHDRGEIHEEHDEVSCSRCHSAGIPGGGGVFPPRDDDGDHDRDRDYDREHDRDRKSDGDDRDYRKGGDSGGRDRYSRNSSRDRDDD